MGILNEYLQCERWIHQAHTRTGTHTCSSTERKCNLKCIFLKRASEINIFESISMHLKSSRESKRHEEKEQL